MHSYRHILVALDWGPGHEQLVARAADLANRYQARISLVHVVETLPVDPGGELLITSGIDLEGELARRARKQLALLVDRHRLDPGSGQHVEHGATRHEILRLAGGLDVDLILIGRHDRHGLGRLLGSTANAILHQAPCDVLALRLAEH